MTTSTEEVVKWARTHAEELKKDMKWVSGDRSSWWWATDAQLRPQIVARVAAGLQFFQRYSGSDSEWYRRATEAFESSGGGKSMESGAQMVGAMLAAWADQVEAGVIDVPQVFAQREIEVVASDLLSQVRHLIEDPRSHPAAAIVLAGAGVEIGLRAAAEAHGLSLNKKTRPSMSSWAQLLRSKGLLTAQDMKDIEQVGGLRNSAAHGQFDELSRERAGLMEQHVNLILAKLGALAGA